MARPSSTTYEARQHRFGLSDRQWAVLLTTYRPDGRPVGTPVNVVALGDRLVFRTYAESHKFRRLQRDRRSMVAPCDLRGRPTGPAIPGRARLLDGSAEGEAAQAIDRKYPVFQRLLVRLGHRLLRYQTVHFEIHPADRGALWDEDDASIMSAHAG